MPAFQITGSGVIDLRSTSMLGIDGLTFASAVNSTAQLNSSQFGVGGIQGSPITFTGGAGANTLEFFVSPGSFSLASVVFANWSANDSVIFRDTVGSENITGTTQNDKFFITGGNDVITGSGGTDLAVVDWTGIGGNLTMNGAAQITNFAGTALSFFGITSFNIKLGTGNDNIALGVGADTMQGGAGNDTLNSSQGEAVIDGGADNDRWVADFSADSSVKVIDIRLAGVQAAGNGTTYANLEALNMTGGTGNDFFATLNALFSDTLSGGDGNDTLAIGGGGDQIFGGLGNDIAIIDYSARTGNFTMNGPTQITNFIDTTVTFGEVEQFNITLGAGNDSVLLLSGDDTANGGGGNDVLNTAAGAAVVDGGAGNDTWVADFSADTSVKAIDIRLAGVQAAGNGTTYANLEALNLTGGAGNDFFATLNALFNDTLSGGDGNDTLAVGGGGDQIYGGLGNDIAIIDYSARSGNFTMNGPTQITNFVDTTVTFGGVEQFNITLGLGNDNVALGAGADSANGGAGDDTLDTGAGDAVVDGGLGNDRWVADLSGDIRAKSIDLNLAGLQSAGVGTSYQNIERVSISTGIADDRVISLTGVGVGGNDGINTGDGNDTLGVGGGDDNVNGGLGTDLLVINYTGQIGNFTMNGSGQINNFAGSSVTFTGIERFDVTLGNGNDSVVLGAFADTIRGGGGDDTLNSAVGLAEVDGGTGTDRWIGDLSAATESLTVNINLAGRQAAGGGTFYAKLESLNLISGSGNDALTTRKLFLNDTLSSGAGNDTLTVAGGNDNVDGGADDDVLIIDFAGIGGNFTMNGSGQINNFAGTSVNFVNIERFNVTLGDGTNSITLLSGDDTVTGGNGNDVFNTAVGAAVVDGKGGNDYWLADQSLDNVAKTINLNLTGVQLAGNGTSYANIEAIAISTGGGNDVITTFNGLFNDSVSTGEGDDAIKVFGGNDNVDAGLGNDLLIIDYSTAVGNFSMNGAAQINNFAGSSVNFAGIERINAILGAGNDNITLTAGDDTISGRLGNDFMTGGLGVDTMDWRSATGAIILTVNASGGGTVTAAGINTDTFNGFENFWLGSGNDSLVGNDLDNLIDGGLGNDTLLGGVGNDRLVGGSQNDVLAGGDGADTLDGGTGADSLTGGADNDQYYVNSTTDIIIEGAGDGTADTVYSLGTFALAADDDIERLVTTNFALLTALNLTGNDVSQLISGNNGANRLLGLGGNDSMSGSAGADTLDGGTDNDTMSGGLDNDLYYVDSALDVIVENAASGLLDRVQASASFALGSANEIEQLTTTDFAGFTTINLTGNNFAQLISGNNGTNTLLGLGGNDSMASYAGADVLDGGTGNDTMAGGADNDIYYVNGQGDVITEIAGGGTSDTVYTSASYALSAAANIEFLGTTNAFAVTAMNLSGNGTAQRIDGNNGANKILGLGGNDSISGYDENDTLDGGTGDDTLNGDTGNDVYYVDSQLDNVVDVFGQGTADRVLASVSFALDFNDDIELLTTDNYLGLTAINLTGNSIAQELNGNAVGNVLDGLGGNDTLKGFAGADTFVFSTALGASNIDVITDFNVPDDTIQLSAAIFAGLTSGFALTAAEFTANAAGLATNAFQHIIYETDTGNLWFDVDGSGIAARIQFADLASNLGVTAADFFVSV